MNTEGPPDELLDLSKTELAGRARFSEGSTDEETIRKQKFFTKFETVVESKQMPIE